MIKVKMESDQEKKFLKGFVRMIKKLQQAEFSWNYFSCQVALIRRDYKVYAVRYFLDYTLSRKAIGP